MYDMPEIRPQTDALWRALAQRLGVATVELTRVADWTAAWHAPQLLFSQTCGYPFTHALRGQVAYVATPHYAADGCDGANYRSILLARQAAPLEAFRGRVAAFNNRDSMSGMLALQLVFTPLARDGVFFSRAVETGGHLASMAAVQRGEADICAIDCVTLALARKHRPSAVDGLVEVARSPAVPGLPLITRAGDVARLRAAVAEVMADATLAEAREALLLTGASVLAADAYEVIPRLEAEAATQGGVRLW